MKDHGIYTFIIILWFNSKHSILLNNTARNVGIILTTSHWLAVSSLSVVEAIQNHLSPERAAINRTPRCHGQRLRVTTLEKNPCRNHHSSIKYKMGIHCHLSGPHHIPQEFTNQSEWNTNCLLKSSLYSSSIKKIIKNAFLTLHRLSLCLVHFEICQVKRLKTSGCEDRQMGMSTSGPLGG